MSHIFYGCHLLAGLLLTRLKGVKNLPCANRQFAVGGGQLHGFEIAVPGLKQMGGSRMQERRMHAAQGRVIGPGQEPCVLDDDGVRRLLIGAARCWRRFGYWVPEHSEPGQRHMWKLCRSIVKQQRRRQMTKRFAHCRCEAIDGHLLEVDLRGPIPGKCEGLSCHPLRFFG